MPLLFERQAGKTRKSAGPAAPLACGLAFFGADRVVFASDCPFDPEGGPMFIREGIRSIEDLKLSDAERRKIYFENALKLMRLPAGTRER